MTDTSHVTITSDITNYTLSGVTTGSTYFISVSAVNIIGEGTNTTIYGNNVIHPSIDYSLIAVSLVDVSPTPSSCKNNNITHYTTLLL